MSKAGLNGRGVYLQADVSNIKSLRTIFRDIESRFGPIRNIIHTAGVVGDATIGTITDEAFERVLRPKVSGAWNLHVVSEELGLELQSFVLLSSIRCETFSTGLCCKATENSISVPLGNPGQVAYVAGNAFLDSLAAFRRSLGLPAVSLQLGAWESKMIAQLDLTNSPVPPMTHRDGIPLILKALSSSPPVQLIANLNPSFFKLPTVAKDPLFASVLPEPVATGRQVSRAEAEEIVLSSLRQVLELKAEDELGTLHGDPSDYYSFSPDLESSLTSLGIDSIAFTQVRGKVLRELGIEIPMVYLSDVFTIQDVATNVCERLLEPSL